MATKSTAAAAEATAPAEPVATTAPPPWDDPAAGPPSIVTLLSRASADVGAVRKDRTAPGNIGGFQFRGVDAVVNAVHPVLARLGVVLLPEVLEVTRESVPTRAGNTMMNVTVRTRFTFYGPRGDSLSVTTMGEAADAGDKATTKAQSVALRVALLQALLLPTDEPDPDEQGYERAGRAHGAQANPERARREPEPTPEQVEHDSVMAMWADAYGALNPSQQQWVRDNWGDNPQPNTLDRAGMAQALEWMAANVPPA